MVELSQLAEGFGIDAVWTYNFIADRDRFMCLGLIAKDTSTIKVGPAAFSPYELHPLMMANSLMTLNEFSKGRAQIVVGGGGAVMTAMGVRPKKRVRAIRECIEFLKLASTSSQRPVTYEGALFQVNNYHANWLHHPPPFIYAGANGPQSMHMAVGLADGIMTSDFTVDMTRDAHRLIRETAREKGVDADSFALNNYVAWHVKDNEDEAQKEARRNLVLRGILADKYISTFLTTEECQIVRENMGAFWAAFHRQTHVIPGVPEAIIQKLVDHLTLIGTTNNLSPIIDELHAFQNAGLSHIALGLHDNPRQAIELIGKKILPAL